MPDAVLWFAVGAYGLPLAAAGEAVTDSFLRVRSQQRMFALGDAAFVTDSRGTKLPATAQVNPFGDLCGVLWSRRWIHNKGLCSQLPVKSLKAGSSAKTPFRDQIDRI